MKHDALVSLGKHLGMFVERVSVEHSVEAMTPAERLAEARQLLELAKDYLPLLERHKAEQRAPSNTIPRRCPKRTTTAADKQSSSSCARTRSIRPAIGSADTTQTGTGSVMRTFPTCATGNGANATRHTRKAQS